MGRVGAQRPPVIFCLVVGAGIYFSPSQRPFGLSVFVHGPGGPQDLILSNRGRSPSTSAPTGEWNKSEKGYALFAGIPPEYRGKDIPVSVIADGFERTNGSSLHLTGESLYVPVRKQGALLSGVLVNEARDPVPNATVHVAGQTTKPDEDGRLKLPIPGELVNEEMTLDVRADGFLQLYRKQ